MASNRIKRRLPGPRWESYRATILELYLNKNYPLEDVMRHMETEFNFRASKIAYKKKLGRWRVHKRQQVSPRQRDPQLHLMGIHPTASHRSSGHRTQASSRSHTSCTASDSIDSLSSSDTRIEDSAAGSPFPPFSPYIEIPMFDIEFAQELESDLEEQAKAKPSGARASLDPEHGRDYAPCNAQQSLRGALAPVTTTSNDSLSAYMDCATREHVPDADWMYGFLKCLLIHSGCQIRLDTAETLERLFDQHERLPPTPLVFYQLERILSAYGFMFGPNSIQFREHARRLCRRAARSDCSTRRHATLFMETLEGLYTSRTFQAHGSSLFHDDIRTAVTVWRDSHLPDRDLRDAIQLIAKLNRRADVYLSTAEQLQALGRHSAAQLYLVGLLKAISERTVLVAQDAELARMDLLCRCLIKYTHLDTTDTLPGLEQILSSLGTLIQTWQSPDEDAADCWFVRVICSCKILQARAALESPDEELEPLMRDLSALLSIENNREVCERFYHNVDVARSLESLQMALERLGRPELAKLAGDVVIKWALPL